MRRSPAVVLLAATLLLALTAPALGAGPRVVEMRALSYAPARTAFATPGKSILWRNVTNPNRLHDAISSLPDYFGSGLLGTGEESTFRFTAAGTFTYICSIHDVMLGRVEVAPVVAVVSDGAGSRLRITLGTQAFAVTDAYRWTVFLQGPEDAVPRYRRTARAAVVELPVAVPGDWTVMVRLRHRPSGTPSSDSPLVTVTVPG